MFIVLSSCLLYLIAVIQSYIIIIYIYIYIYIYKVLSRGYFGRWGHAK